jgi:hypothetical protein
LHAPPDEARCIISPVFADPPLRKRQLGFLIVLAGVALAVVALGADLLGLGRFNGIGPAQRLALLGASAVVLFGLSLIPLGNRPA